MAWPLVAAAGVLSFAQGAKARDQAKAQKITGRANAYVQNQLRLADNELNAAKGSLNRFMQSRQNQIHLENAGSDVEAVGVNLSRLGSEATKGTFTRRLEAAGQLGAVAAQTGATGAAGTSTSDMMNQTVAIRAAMMDQDQDEQVRDAGWDMKLQMDAARSSMILGLSDMQFLDNINFLESHAAYVDVPSWFEVALGAGMSAGQTYVATGMGAKTGGSGGGAKIKTGG